MKFKLFSNNVSLSTATNLSDLKYRLVMYMLFEIITFGHKPIHKQITIAPNGTK